MREARPAPRAPRPPRGRVLSVTIVRAPPSVRARAGEHARRRSRDGPTEARALSRRCRRLHLRRVAFASLDSFFGHALAAARTLGERLPSSLPEDYALLDGWGRPEARGATERELAARPEDQPRPRPELRVHRVHCARKSHCAKALGAPYPPCAADGQEQPQ